MGAYLHYNQVIESIWREMGFRPMIEYSCQTMPYDGHQWSIRYPNKADINEHDVVIMHCQDFLSTDSDTCRELDAMQQYFDDLCNKVVVVHWNRDLRKKYRGPMHLVYFPTHSYELLDSIMDQPEWKDQLQSPRSFNWQCLNGQTKRHRKQVARYLKSVPNGILSFGDQIPLPISPYSRYQNCNNVKNWQELLPVYADCDINIVTESIYQGDCGIISEKTVMSILALQVPLIIGYRGIVQHCQDIGLDMFTDIVDTSYDDAPDETRWQLALDSNRHLLETGIDRPALAARLRRNQNIMLSWPRTMIMDYRNRCREVGSLISKR